MTSGALPGRLRAALVDEAVIALSVLLLYAMAFQTGVVALMAMPLSRLATAPAAVLGVDRTALTAWLTVVVVALVVRLVYRVAGTGSPSGQTPGKRLAGLRVVTAGGTPPGYRIALVREAVLLAELITVVGLAGALARPPWHDVVARTRLAAAPDG